MAVDSLGKIFNLYIGEKYTLNKCTIKEKHAVCCYLTKNLYKYQKNIKI